jgi:hypothetical protein
VQVSVEDRWSAEQLLTHPFLKTTVDCAKLKPLIEAAKKELNKTH